MSGLQHGDSDRPNLPLTCMAVTHINAAPLPLHGNHHCMRVALALASKRGRRNAGLKASRPDSI
eukprot:4308441-Lingulodinium_polyedra.AAC.1